MHKLSFISNMIIQQFEVPTTTLPKTSNSDTQHDQDQEIDHSTDSNQFDTSDDTSDNNSEILVDHTNDPDDYCRNITDELNFDPNESIYYTPKQSDRTFNKRQLLRSVQLRSKVNPNRNILSDINEEENITDELDYHVGARCRECS
ncbi:hypothetical protein EV182_008710 [Spiromyces aspiralis]|uniref:Uncharacterized protein n=1 Tax=Spiromyces aspiralis TaxID=68401 RepID=A0ACC1HIJ7_9FUNG|nr:hypothetical protein EV182_008710 [Spiromyces aspiralis]